MASHWGVNTAHMLLTTQSRQVTFHGGLYQKRHNEKATYTLYTSSLLSRPAHIPWRTAAAGQDHSPPLWRGCRCCTASSPTDLRTSAETTETQMIPTNGARQVASSHTTSAGSLSNTVYTQQSTFGGSPTAVQNYHQSHRPTTQITVFTSEHAHVSPPPPTHCPMVHVYRHPSSGVTTWRRRACSESARWS